MAKKKVKQENEMKQPTDRDKIKILMILDNIFIFICEIFDWIEHLILKVGRNERGK